MRLHKPKWRPESWQNFEARQHIHYKDPLALQSVLKALHHYPPLVFVGEVETLKSKLADACYGKSFLLQGGDCAESFSDCRAEIISQKVKILLQMASVLGYGLQKPILCTARIAGQYTKPRSQAFEWIHDEKLLSFRGESIHSLEAHEQARTPDPFRLLRAYHNSALTLNYIRSLASGGFADFHKPEQWRIEIFKSSPHHKKFEELMENIRRSILFIHSLGVNSAELKHMNFFTCHEGLHLPLEQALTHESQGLHYNLSSHMLWIGNRTRQLDGAHLEYFRGIANPIAIKLGQNMDGDELLEILNLLNPNNEAGRITLVTRFGYEHVSSCLPALVRKVQKAGKIVLWACDPMHGNTILTPQHYKTRLFRSILSELHQTYETHRQLGSFLGGVHFELTGEDVTECLGGLEGLEEKDLASNYRTYCDPRLNYHQSLELAFTLASMLSGDSSLHSLH